MEWFDTNVASRDATLQETPEVFKTIGMNLPVNIPFCVIDNLMSKLRSKPFVRQQGVGVEGRSSFYMLSDFGLQDRLLATRNNICPNVSATFKDAHHGSLIASASTSDAALAFVQVHVPRFASDKGFVNLDLTAQLAKGFILQRQTNPMEHEPCSFLSGVQITRNFTTTNSVLAVGEQPQCGKPLVQTDSGVLAKTSDLNRELALGMMLGALPSAALRIVANTIRATARTDNAIRPAPNGKIGNAVIGIREIDDCFLKALRFAHGLALHKQNYRLKPWASQVNNCPFKGKPEEMADSEIKKHYDLVGKGIVTKVPLEQVMRKREKLKDWYWIWDGNHTVEENELLRKEGFKVFGGGKYADLMEHDRDAALKFAKKYGLQSSPSFPFTDTATAIKFCEQNEEMAYVFKPDEGENFETWVPESESPEDANAELVTHLKSLQNAGSFILQERKDGVETNVEVWFVKGEPRFAFMGIESKKKIVGDMGEMVGCAFDFTFEIPLDSKAVRESVGKLFPAYKKMNYTGFGDANFIAARDGVWFFEKCERFGYNA